MSADESKAAASTMSNLPSLVEEDESAVAASPSTSLDAQSRLPYVTMDNKPPSPPKIQSFSPEVERYWSAKYDEAHELYDAGEYNEVIKMLKSFIDDPECPQFCHIRFMILLGTCYAEHYDVEFWVSDSFFSKTKARLLTIRSLTTPSVFGRSFAA
jgi:hypothetical protein